MIVCGADGVQRLIVQRDGWWVVEDRDTRECLTGGFKTRAEARRAALALIQPPARDRTDALEQRLAEVRDEADAWHARAEAAERRVAAVEAVLHDAELRGGGTRWVDATVRHVRAALAESTATEEPA